MKAYVLHAAKDLRYEDVPTPVPKEGEVLLKVMAAGICGSDIPRIYQNGAHVMPLIPGHEFSGIVAKTGPGVSEKWIGTRTAVFPLIPCMKCDSCRSGHYEMCRNYNYLGSRCNGGFAEYCAVPVKNLLPIPDSVTYEQAAMMEPMAVAVHAIRRLGITGEDRDQTVTVCGLGTIGLLIVMFLREMGMTHILAIGNRDYQKKAVLLLGVRENSFCNSKKEDPLAFIQKHTGEKGTDFYFECVGRNETMSLALEAAAPLGKVLFVGNPLTDVTFPRDTYWKILRKQLTVRGTWNSSFQSLSESKSSYIFDTGIHDDWTYVLDSLTGGKIHPELLISHRYLLSDLGQGFAVMHEKRENYTKIMAVLH